MAEELDLDTVTDRGLEPQFVSVDDMSVRQRPLSETISALRLKHSNTQLSATNRKGLRFEKIVPPGICSEVTE